MIPVRQRISILKLKLRMRVQENVQSLSSEEHSVKPLVYRNQAFGYLLCFFICGLINNTGYVLVGTAAQEVAHHFGKDSFMGAFNLSLVIFSIFLVAVNANLCLTISHKKRISVLLLISCFASSLIGVSTSIDQSWAFYTALIGSTLMGCTQSLGEVGVLGFAKGFPSILVGGFSSGTGMAGPFGASIYLALVAVGVKDLYIFLCLVPCQFLYYSAFLWLDKKRLVIKSEKDDELIVSDGSDSVTNKKLSLGTFCDTLRKYSGWYSLNLGLVYYFEYTCLVCWADLANPKNDQETEFFKKNAFAVLTFAYQIGVFMSRSSLAIIKIQRVWILTLIQMCNTAVWIYIATQGGVDIQYQIILMVFVGLMGGASYVNVAYLILSSKKIPDNMKELCMNINNICNNIGVTSASITAIVVSNLK